MTTFPSPRIPPRARATVLARVDSIAREAQLRRERERNRYLFNGTGWYIGLSGGGAIPTGELSAVGYDNGYTVNVPIGWHARSSLLGVRLDLGYSQFAGQSFVGSGTGGTPLTLSNNDPKVLSATLNLTARIPLNGARTFHLYGVGGGRHLPVPRLRPDIGAQRPPGQRRARRRHGRVA